MLYTIYSIRKTRTDYFDFRNFINWLLTVTHKLMKDMKRSRTESNSIITNSFLNLFNLTQFRCSDTKLTRFEPFLARLKFAVRINGIINSLEGHKIPRKSARTKTTMHGYLQFINERSPLLFHDVPERFLFVCRSSCSGRYGNKGFSLPEKQEMINLGRILKPDVSEKPKG